MEYPMAPLVLGIILGDILDKNLRRALVLSNGSLVPFFTRPICLGIFLVTLFVIVNRTVWFKQFVGAIKGMFARKAEG
jgi:putative tricarboxylic transport membrane protein